MENNTSITAEPGRQELFITREFNAPRELVFKAFTDPELVVQWMGPRELTMTIEKWDARSGGEWKYISTDPAGNKYGFHGCFHEIKAPERCIQTFEFDGLPESGHVILDTARFENLEGNRSRVVIHSVYQSVADRDGMLQSGMEGGMNTGFQRLDELFAAQLVA